LNLEQPLLSSEINIEIKNFEHLWYQGPTAFKDAQISAKKIFKLLKLNYGSLFSNEDLVKKMRNRLGHLNRITDSEIKNLLGDDLIE